MPHERKAPEGYEQPDPSVAKPPKFYDVPEGTLSARCQGHKKGGTCQKLIYWIEYDAPDRKKPGATKRVRQPIDVEVPDGLYPGLRSAGRGVSHYTTCPDTRLFGR